MCLCRGITLIYIVVQVTPLPQDDGDGFFPFCFLFLCSPFFTNLIGLFRGHERRFWSAPRRVVVVAPSAGKLHSFQLVGPFHQKQTQTTSESNHTDNLKIRESSGNRGDPEKAEDFCRFAAQSQCTSPLYLFLRTIGYRVPIFSPPPPSLQALYVGDPSP